ncbi:MAG: hypothetical protein HOO96_17800 [Polyangiaceae bacterium]|nr:hypothetical protein [Polyangiaceae bacterium]
MSASRISFVAIALVLAACSKSKGDGEAVTTSSAAGTVEGANKPAPSGGTVVTCMTTAGLCSEWSGLTLGELKEAQDSCDDPGDKFGSTPCPRKNAFASCKHPKEKVTLFLPKTAGFTMKDAKEMCEDGELSQIK